MSVWNEKMRRRKKIVIVREILQRWWIDAHSFWGLLILDTEGKGKEHVITGCTSEDLEQIHAGSKVEISIKESVTGWRVLPMKPRKETAEKIPSVPYFMWSCAICRKRGYVEYTEGEDLLEVGIRICNAHLEATPRCKKLNLRIFDHNGKEQKDFMQVMALEKVE